MSAATLKVMSWYLKYLGKVKKEPDELRIIAKTILENNVDIVCIQGLMHGHKIDTKIGTPITKESIDILENIRQELKSQDSNATWEKEYTGRNAGRSKSFSGTKYLADAYGFLWKKKSSSIIEIKLNTEPYIMPMKIEKPANDEEPANDEDLMKDENFPNRRPCMIIFDVSYKNSSKTINIISFHATTPSDCMTDDNYRPAAGKAISKLIEFDEITGDDNIKKSTIILGNFNYDLSQENANKAYRNIRRYYKMRIGAIGEGNDIKTTYSFNPCNKGDERFESSYDNIFDRNLRYKEGSGQRIDFLQKAVEWEMANNLIDAHMRYYYWENSDHERGVSDHLPVIVEYILY